MHTTVETYAAARGASPPRYLKARLLAEGLRVGFDLAAAAVKTPTRVRSGSCGGLDVVLPGGTYVNCPVHEPFAARSSLLLTQTRAGFTLSDKSAGWSIPVTVPPEPAYYGRTTDDGIPLRRLGQLCSDRLGIGLTNICTFWRTRSKRCKFCSIGLNVRSEQSAKSLQQIVDVAAAAFSDPVAAARHVLLGGGTPEGPDAGAGAIASAAEALKERWDHPIYAMLAPPEDLAWLDELQRCGVDEIGINIELWSERAAERFVPGKHAAIGRARYLRTLERAVDLFGPVNTRSIMVVGLEPFASTIAGVEELARRGVMPILSPLRPLAGTQLEHHPPLAADALERLTDAAAEVAARHGMPLGPTCLACQANTLTADHPLHRTY